MPVVVAFSALASAIAARPARLGSVRLVAVDGYAGAGKSTFADRLATALGAQVIHTDDLLAGWHDTVTFWPRLEEWVLGPLRSGRPGRYQRFDWVAGHFAAWHDVPARPFLVVEGVTAARAVVRHECTATFWVTTPKRERTRRGVERDGELLLPEWVRWQEAEEAHVAVDRTPESVDCVVDGSPTIEHDAATQAVIIRGITGEPDRPILAGS